MTARFLMMASIMPFDPGLLGAVALVLAPFAPAAHGSAMMVPLCGGGFAPFPYSGDAPQRRSDCDMACHALCRSNRMVGEDGGDEDA